MARLELKTFTVEGKGPFPLDMLRYDSCWPASNDDVVNMMWERGPRRSVKLQCYRERGQDVATTGRWSSFLWSVVER